jgi:hypothetical protein
MARRIERSAKKVVLLPKPGRQPNHAVAGLGQPATHITQVQGREKEREANCLPHAAVKHVGLFGGSMDHPDRAVLQR